MIDARPAGNAQAISVLLAAGAGRRYGGIKQLAEIEGEPMLRRVAQRALAAGVPLIVVTGARAARVERALTALPLLIERHRGWAEGIGSSLAAGVRRACAQFPCASAVLVCLADQPLLDTALLVRLLERHRVAPTAILVSSLQRASTPPVLFPRDCFERLMAWRGTRGAHALLEREAHRVERFDCAQALDVDTPADLERVRNALAATAHG